MEREQVDSETLKSMRFDPETLTLELEFTEGAIYQYYDVPENVYKDPKSASSLGAFFNINIRHNYRFRRI